MCIFAKNGAAEGRLRDATYAYNHADWYVEEVLGFADRYVKGNVEVNKSEAASRGNTGISVVDVGNKWIGNSVYVFGRGSLKEWERNWEEQLKVEKSGPEHEYKQQNIELLMNQLKSIR